jgi:hypothetical protein
MEVARHALGEDSDEDSGEDSDEGPDEAKLRDLIRSELKRVASLADLRSFEVPRDFIIELEPFTHHNGLLSSVHKRMRPALEARYGERLEGMYTQLEGRQHTDLIALRSMGSGMSVLQRVSKALEVALGISDIDVAGGHGFVDLGGDSLGAAAFSEMIEDIFGVALPVNAILSSGHGRSRRRLATTTISCPPSSRFMAPGPAGSGPLISTSPPSLRRPPSSGRPARQRRPSRAACC